METTIRKQALFLCGIFGLFLGVSFAFPGTQQKNDFSLTAESGLIEGNRLEPGPVARLVLRYACQRRAPEHTLGIRTSFAPELLLASSMLYSWRWNGRLDYATEINTLPVNFKLHAGALTLASSRYREYTYRIAEARIQTQFALSRQLMLLPGGGVKMQFFSGRGDEGVTSVPLESILFYRFDRKKNIALGAAWEKYFVDGGGESGVRYSPVIRFAYKGRMLFSLGYQYYIYRGALYQGREHRLRFNLGAMINRQVSLLLNGSLIFLPSSQELRTEQENVSGLGERSNIYLKTVYDLTEQSDLFFKYIYERDRFKNDYKSFSWQVLVGLDYVYGGR